MRILTLLSFSLLSLSHSVYSQFTVTEGKVSISSGGEATFTHSFNDDKSLQKRLPTVSPGPKDSLKLSFTVSSKLNGEPEPIQPNQAMVMFTAVDGEGRKDWSSAVKVRKGGKGKWELDVAKAPAILRSLSPSGNFLISLIIGSSGHSEGLRLPILNFEFPSSLIVPQPYPALENLPTEWEANKYALEKEIHWTFRAGEKQPFTVLVMIFTVALVGPWIVLAGLISKLQLPSFSLSPSIAVFLGLLTAFDGLIFYYWTSLKLFQAMPWFGVLGILLILSGREALGEIKRRRELKEAKEGGKKKE